MIRLLEFHRSPNCAKVRVALGYKDLPFEPVEMSASDRAPMLTAAGWPLVPVLLDGPVSMRDSEAILHYLESNYRDRPSLTPATIEEIRRGEALRDAAQQNLRPLLRRIYGAAMRAPADRDPELVRGIGEEVRAAVLPLERELSGKPFLLGERLSLYDIVVGCALMPARPNPVYAAQSPLWAFLLEHVSLPADVPNVHGWLDRVLAFDPAGPGR